MKPGGEMMRDLLLAIDVGNTEVKLGVFREEDLITSLRASTRRQATEDEWALQIEGFFRLEGVDPAKLRACVLSSTVPPVTPVLELAVSRRWHLSPLIVRPGVRTGMPILYDPPQEVGPDRIVNGVAAVEGWGGPAVIVDFGTATTFDVISPGGEYLGGVIAPGIGISADALFHRAARLSRVEILDPGCAVGRNTTSAIQSGLYHGYMGLVEGILSRVCGELAEQHPDAAEPTVLATGGHAALIAPACPHIAEVVPDLTLRGLRLVWERNR